MSEYKILLGQGLYIQSSQVLANLEEKLRIAISNNPKKDFKEQELIISVFRDLYFNWLEVVEENRIMDKKYLKMANKVDFLKLQMHDLAQENKKLLKENDNLKNNIL